MRPRLAWSCFFVLLLAAGPARAQRTTGTIVGTVADASGGALPGVTVTLKGEAVVGTQTSVTNAGGFFRFAALPPGEYTLTYSLTGFRTQKRADVHVSVGATNEENATLAVGGLEEEITVTGEKPVVDTSGNQVSTNYDKDWVRNAPIPRFTFFDLINAAPGVNQAQAGDSRSTSLGSASTDNSYQLDGTDFTAPLTGAAWPWPNTDAIEEIEVLSLGAPAEYGNLLGAVFNVTTRQGSNAFHGSANYYHQSDALTSRNTTFDQDGGFPYKRVRYRDATFQLDGPIVKDKLWFFASYQYQRDFQAPTGTDPAFPNRFQADRVFGKLNWQIDAKNKVQLAYHDDYYRIPCIDNACNALTAPSSVKVEHGHNPSPNVTFTSTRSNKTYVEVRVSGFYGSDHADPLVASEPRVKPRVNDLETGEITGGIYSWYDGDIWKTAVSAKVSHFADSFLGGSHDFRFGVQWNDGGHDYLEGYNDYVYAYGGVPAFGYTQIPFHLAGKERALGVWADDTYRLGPRVTLNLGLRYDRSRASFGTYEILDRAGNPTGQTTAAVNDLFTWNTVSPRVGVNWKVTADGHNVLKAHYGRYYRGIVTGEFDNVSPSVSPRFLFSGAYDEAGEPIDPVLVADNSQLRVDPGLKSPYTDQFIVGYERELAKGLGLALNYVHKRGQRYAGWRDVTGQYTPVIYSDTEGVGASGRDITVLRLDSDPAESVFVLTNRGELFTRYHGLTVQLTKRMTNWQATASLVWSKASGRLPASLGGPTDEPTGTATGPGSRFGQNPNDFINTDGRLIHDRPLTAKVQFVYQFPKGFLVGLNFNHQKGRPYGRLVQLPAELVGLPTNILAERLDGSRRVGTWNVLDLRVQKEFALSGAARLALFADGLNVTNDDASDGVGSRLGTSEGFGVPTDFILPRRLMLGAKLSF
jgi:hypothetical protein